VDKHEMTTLAEDVLRRLRETDALLEGHFLLTSGLHSAGYVQCAKALQYPQHAEVMGTGIAERVRHLSVDVVMSPAIGGIVLGQEVARALGVRAIFGEREQGRMTLRRGFDLTPGERVLVVEDVTTTGGSVREVIVVAQARGGNLVAAAAILDRSDGTATFPAPFHALATLQIQTYAADACPLCQGGSEPVKPGSRQV
jgi:orotate phosphoribosyltransferase